MLASHQIGRKTSVPSNARACGRMLKNTESVCPHQTNAGAFVSDVTIPRYSDFDSFDPRGVASPPTTAATQKEARHTSAINKLLVIIVQVVDIVKLLLIP